MISNQLGPAGRFLLAAAAICAFVAPWAGVRAEEPSAGGSDEVVRPIVEPPTARAARPPHGPYFTSYMDRIRTGQPPGSRFVSRKP